MEKVGNSNHITRRYIDSLLIETRYLDSTVPTTEFSLYGETFSTPVMTAAISHLDHHIFEGASTALAEGVGMQGGMESGTNAICVRSAVVIGVAVVVDIRRVRS